MSSIFSKVKSELAKHTVAGGKRDDEDDSWVVAGDTESVDSFLTNCPPSYMEKSWISASHEGMTQLVEEYYITTMGAKGVMGSSQESWGRDNMDEIKQAWEESEVKTLETLTAVLKVHKYGCGKWMIFINASDVDAVWRKVVTALWDGKLGHSAKCSGNTADCNGSHVINVYVECARCPGPMNPERRGACAADRGGGCGGCGGCGGGGGGAVVVALLSAGAATDPSRCR